MNHFDKYDALSTGNHFDKFDDAEPPKPELFRGTGDSAIAFGSGVIQGIKMLTDVAGADNAASRVLGKATDALTDLESP